MRLRVLALPALVLAVAACGDDAEEKGDCARFASEATACIEAYCDENAGGAYCGCYLDGGRVVQVPSDGAPCSCSNVTVEQQLAACDPEELPAGARFDCEGYLAQLREHADQACLGR